MSLSAQNKLFEGRETTTRKLDATVYDKRQLYVVAQANDGSAGFSNYAGAKNSLSVGASFDAGEIVYFSSHGPTADGRLAPQVVATGVDVCSAKGDGSPAGYDCSSGTSMAAPAVAGVAALLMDANPDKIVANRVYTAAPRAAVAYTVIRGAATPSLAIEAESRALGTRGDGQTTKVSLAIAANAYVASGTSRHFACQGAATDCAEVEIADLSIERLDGTTADGSAAVAGEMEAPESVPLEARIPLGEIAVGESRHAQMRIAFAGAAPVRIYAVASGWNAAAASASVLLRPTDDAGDQPEAEVPANDDFATPAVVEGRTGSASGDLVRAAPEPGEPLYQGGCLDDDCFSTRWSKYGCDLRRTASWFERPRGSIWYQWTAPTNDLAWFRVAIEAGTAPDGVALSVYEGESLAALHLLATNHWEEGVVIASANGSWAWLRYASA